MKNNKISSEDLIKIIEIGYDNLEDFLNGLMLENDFPIDLKKKCIFRGVSNYKYELIPNALRKEKDGNYVICRYIHQNLTKDYHSTNFKDIGCDNKELTLELQFKREFFILFRFLDWADKSGLKVPVGMGIRKLLHSNINHPLKNHWPKSKYYEVIALAQHYNLPTCVFDWLYNYKISLYFSVKDVLYKNKCEITDGVLWAFNYKHFEKESEYVIEEGIKEEEKPQLRFYRPQYFHNSNIKAQKGLFTFLINDENTFNPNEIKPLDKFVCDMVIEDGGLKKYDSEIDLHGIENFTLEKDEKIFYKFIIKKECKATILEKLYSNYYSEEYLFPGYRGVADAMKNWATLQDIIKKKIMFICTRNTCRSVMAEVIFKQMNEENDNIEVYSSGIKIKNRKYPSGTIQVCNNHGIDISKHEVAYFKDSNIKDMDLVLTFEKSHKEKILTYCPNVEVYTINEFIDEDSLDIKDPYGKNYNAYEKCFNEIYHVLKKVNEVCEEKFIIH